MVVYILVGIVGMVVAVSYFLTNVDRRCDLEAVSESEKFAKLNQELISSRMASLSSENQMTHDFIEQR